MGVEETAFRVATLLRPPFTNSRLMNPVQKVIAWLRRPAGVADAKTAVEAQRLRDERETIRGSQPLVGQMGPSLPNLAPTPDVLNPGRKQQPRP
jgi:hypothetical protein